MVIEKFQLLILLLIFILLKCIISTQLPTEFSIINEEEKHISEERVVELFQSWKEKHRKVYKHAEEAEMRYRNFRDNLIYVLEKNLKKGSNSGHTVGLNKLADLSNEEFRKTFISKIKKPLNKKRSIENKNKMGKKTMTSCEGPSSFDWRKQGVVTAIKDQGSCGSCWSFSSTGAIEGINAIVTGDLVSLSEQALIDCDTTNYGCEGGYMDYAFEWVISSGGIDTESGYPYTGLDGTCNTTEEATKVVSIDGYTDIEEDESALFCAVLKQPISVGIDGGEIDFQLYTGGIYDGECSDDPDDIDHAVLIVGYGAENYEKYWIVKNSWGTDWGIEGYIYIRRGTSKTYGVCAINAMASYPTKESSSSPSPSSSQPPPPPPPPPPSPSPSQCGDYSYCASTETCCCILEIFDYCFIYGCCEYTDAVCCTGTEYCCPNDYPVCDTEEGLCLQNNGDRVGVALKKRTLAKHKFPWTKPTGAGEPLWWKRNNLAAVF